VFDGTIRAIVDDDCSELNAIGDAADGSLTQLGYEVHFVLQALRNGSIQPSDPEAVLDHVIYDLCSSQGAEVPEEDEGPE
jgi:hypothetical protein